MTTPRGKVHRFTSPPATAPKTYTPAASTGAYAAPTRPSAALENVDAARAARRRSWATTTAGRLTSEDHGRPSARSPTTVSRIASRGHARAGRRRRQADDRRTPTTGCCRSRSSSAACRGQLRLHARRPLLPTAEKLTVGATSSPATLAFDNDRLATKSGPFTIERIGPGGRGLEDHRRQARRSSYAYDANGRPATRTLKRRRRPSASSRSSRSTTWAGRHARGARGRRRAGHARPTATTASGQLLTVKRGATVLEDHAYDGDGQPPRRRRGLRRPGPADHARRRRATRGTRTGSSRPAARTRSPTRAPASCSAPWACTYAYDALGPARVVARRTRPTCTATRPTRSR